ncbi:MAG: glycosyltransferase family 9 protein [bacterium]
MRPLVEKLEYWFRHRLVYPLLRFIFRNPESNAPLHLHSIRKILILRYDRLGDMIVTTPIFRTLKSIHPALSIGVFASPGNAELIKKNPFIDTIFLLEKNWFRLFKEILRARREQYSVVLNFIFNRTTSGALLANIIAPEGYKVGQGDEKYRFYYNRLLKLDRLKAHMVETLYSIIDQVFHESAEGKRFPFEIFIDEKSKAAVDRYLRTHNLVRYGSPRTEGNRYILLNPSAGDRERQISQTQAKGLMEFMATLHPEKTISIVAPNDTEMIGLLKRESKKNNLLLYPEEGVASLLEIASLLEGALFAITPDTSIVHFASAMKTPVLGIYTPLKEVHEWLPYQVPYAAVRAEEQKPVSSIPIETLVAAVKNFSGSMKNR